MQIARIWYSGAAALSLLAALCLLGGCGQPAAPPASTAPVADNTSSRPAPPPPPPRPSAPGPNAQRNDSNEDEAAGGDGTQDSDLTTEGELPSEADADSAADGQDPSAPPREVAYDETGHPIPGGSDGDAESRSSRDDGDSSPALAGPDRPPPETAADAIAALEEIGGRVHLEGGAAVKVFLNRTDATDWHMQAVALLGEVRVLNISHTQVTDAGLEHLHALAKLEHLYPNGTAVTDAGVEALGKALPKTQVLR